MPEQDESTPTPERPIYSEDLPPAITPPMDPAKWEDFEGFRETFLLHFSDQKANSTLRGLGDLLYELVLEFEHFWPRQPEGVTRSELRAVVADLRHSEGYLRAFGEQPEQTELTPYEEHLCRVAARQAEAVKAAADAIEAELGSWRGEAEP